MRLVFVLILIINSCSITKKETPPGSDLVRHLSYWYNEDTGLWDTTSWWNGANVLTALIEYGRLTENDSLKKLVATTFERTREFEVSVQGTDSTWTCKNYINDYYDDESWWALAWLDAWEWTGNSDYLEMSRIIFSDIIKGWDETCGGGMYWKKNNNYKGTITNELTIVVATRLHLEGIKEVNGVNCLDLSRKIWTWMESHQVRNEDNQMQDGVRQKDGNCVIAPNVWTYNQGVILSGLVNLHRITQEDAYLSAAHEIAGSALQIMIDDQGILKELRCEPEDCNPDAEQFKGIFMRHLMVLHGYSARPEYKLFLENNARSIIDMATDKGRISPGVSWSVTSDKGNAATTTSALDAVNAYVRSQRVTE